MALPDDPLPAVGDLDPPTPCPVDGPPTSPSAEPEPAALAPEDEALPEFLAVVLGGG